jgi:hypothetical protein
VKALPSTTLGRAGSSKECAETMLCRLLGHSGWRITSNEISAHEFSARGKALVMEFGVLEAPLGSGWKRHLRRLPPIYLQTKFNAKHENLSTSVQ